jgi:hypothetical protein
MKQLYKYTGSISGYSYEPSKLTGALHHLELTLFDLNDRSKAPIRIDAFGGLADYIYSIEGTDAEERYIPSTWIYDELLRLCRIEIPSTNPRRPAKIIAQRDPLDCAAAVFGPTDYIQTGRPEPLDADQYSAWIEYRSA